MDSVVIKGNPVAGGTEPLQPVVCHLLTTGLSLCHRAYKICADAVRWDGKNTPDADGFIQAVQKILFIFKYEASVPHKQLQSIF